MNKTEIENNLAFIKKELDVAISPDDIQGVMDKLMKLQTLDSLSAECMRYAKAISRNTMREELEKMGDTMKLLKIPVSHIKLLLDSKMGEFEALELYADRINAAIHHGLESLRTAISFYKQQMIEGHFNINT